MSERNIKCEYFLHSKKCSIRTESEDPPGPCFECFLVASYDPAFCPAKAYFADPGPYVNEVPISLYEFILTVMRCAEFGNANMSDACSQCPDYTPCSRYTARKRT